MPCRIEIDELELTLSIGCTEEERRQPQPIRIRARVASAGLFAASRTDRVEDTLDAERLRGTIGRAAASARVQTLERLAALIEEALRAEIGRRGLEWELAISKPRFGWTYVHAWST